MRISVISLLCLFINLAWADIDRGLTPHFINWLNSNGYSSYSFNRSDLSGGSYGGRSLSSDNGSGKQPVIFIHGWSDVAVGN